MNMIKRKKSTIVTFTLALFWANLLFSQTNQYKIDEFSVQKENLYENLSKSYLTFKGANYNFEESDLPYFNTQKEIASNQEFSNVSLINSKISTITAQEIKNELIKLSVPTEFKVEVTYSYYRKQKRANFTIYPIRLNKATNQYERLESFDIKYDKSNKIGQRNYNKAANFSSNSLLANGEWFKIAVAKDAVFKLNAGFFQRMGVDIVNVNPQTIKIYGKGAGILKAANSKNNYDDLQELSIQVIGEEDGIFNTKDYVLFYGQGPHEKRFDSINNKFRHVNNVYNDSTYYFLTFGGTMGRRLAIQNNSTATPTHLVNSFNDFQFYENDKVNFLKSGQLWVGEQYDAITSYQFNFNFPNIDKNSPARIDASFYGRSATASNITVSVGNSSTSSTILPLNLNAYLSTYANGVNTVNIFNPTSPNVTVNTSYSKPQSSSKAWLNFIEVNVRRNLNFVGNQIIFSDFVSADSGNVSRFEIVGQLQNSLVWDISNMYDIKLQRLNITPGKATFTLPTNSLKEFVVFDDGDTAVNFVSRVTNQNLHALSNIDYIIVAHPLFLQDAQVLAEFHSNSGLRVEVVTPQQIYNEFSSGSQDPVAIRTFMRMLYERATTQNDLPKYLLLYGDGSYDNRDRLAANTNFIVTFESSNSTNPISSYVSEDYFGLLDINEGTYSTSDVVDIGIGRLPVKNAKESQSVLNKILNYGNGQTLGSWRNEFVFIADDGDNTVHMNQANVLARRLDSVPEFNINKIYLDAYPLASTPGGDRYPQVTNAINAAVDKGVLMLNFTGHGGETGWTAERVVGMSEIFSWDNSKKLPLFITATCEFSRFDDPARNSGGEVVLLNEKGGGIALMTTTRVVFAAANFVLNDSLYSSIVSNLSNNLYRIGDIFADTKAKLHGSTNARNFVLLGDPAIRLVFPKNKVITTHINGKPLNNKDTLKALSKVNVRGYISDENGNILNNFNGIVYPTVFDKFKNLSTLNNRGIGAYKYKAQNSILFKGKAKVINGEFEFNFIVPKDISYNMGDGKISYYADNGIADANGFTKEFFIGGTSGAITSDDQGPEMEVYLNDKAFVNGGVTNENPNLIVDMFDLQGINTVGNGVGHDLVAYLDDKTDETFVLNEFYESKIDDYSRGTIKYPFKDLKEGIHKLTIKAWDSYNNSSLKTIDFEVYKEKDVKIENVLNYPNPFTTKTQFLFEHNQAGQVLDVKVDIFTVNGKLVRSIYQTVQNEGYLSRNIEWDGRDDFGDKIGRGVYVYRLKVWSRNGSVAEKFEKLVIL